LKIFKFNDYNANGVWEQGEPALAGFRFNVAGPESFTAVSDEHGEIFKFGISYGTYKITEVETDGWEATTDNPQTVVLNSEDLVEARFGNRQIPVTTAPTTTSTTIPDCGIVAISARGIEAAGIKPIMQLWIDGRMKAQWYVLSDTREYVYDANLCTGGHNVDIVYTNDCSTSTVNRDLYVYYIKAGGQTIESDETGVKYDRGTGSGAFDGNDVINGQAHMEWNGALRFKLNGGAVTTTTTTTSTTTTTQIGCSDKWYYDNDHMDKCRNATFCGSYMYYGLRTYATQQDCQNALFGTGTCTLVGDYAPCGTVTIQEVVDLINKWVANQAEISDVIDLIYAYRDSQ
jgi:hypothetical protein